MDTYMAGGKCNDTHEYHKCSLMIQQKILNYNNTIWETSKISLKSTTRHKGCFQLDLQR